MILLLIVSVACEDANRANLYQEASLVLELKALTDFQSIRNSSKVTAVHYYKSTDQDLQEFSQGFARLASALSGVISFAALNITDTQLAKASTPFVRLYFGNRSNLAPVHVHLDTEAGHNWMLIGKQILEKVSENLLLPADGSESEFELIATLDSRKVIEMVHGSHHPWAILLHSKKVCEKTSESLGYSCERLETNFKYMSTVFSKPSATIKRPLVFARANCDLSVEHTRVCEELYRDALQANVTISDGTSKNGILLVEPDYMANATRKFRSASLVTVRNNDVLNIRAPIVEFANQTSSGQLHPLNHLASAADFLRYCLDKSRLGCIITFVPPVTDDETFAKFQKEYYQLELNSLLFARYKLSHLFSFSGHQPELEAALPLGKQSAYGAVIIYANGQLTPLPAASAFDSRRFKQFLTSALSDSLPRMKLPPIAPPIKTVARWDDPNLQQTEGRPDESRSPTQTASEDTRETHTPAEPPTQPDL